MRRLAFWCSTLAFGALLAACGSTPQGGANSTPQDTLSTQSVTLPGPIDRRLTPAGSSTPQAAVPGSGALQDPEFPSEPGTLDSPFGAQSVQSRGLGVNRRLPQTRPGAGVNAGNFMAQGITFFPRVKTSFDGLNFRDQRTANGGNQFSLEPPDQALCVGNGYVLESVNSVLRVYDRAGTPKTGVVDLNTFYGYPAAIKRTSTPPVYGPDLVDPVCLYDAPTQRWFHVVFTLATNPVTGADTGKVTLDIAVSQTSDPTGAWNVYRLPAQNDGTDGTPVHADCPCLPDYPHIGADANGFYITTNEFPFSGGFNGAQIYAIDKRALAAGDPDPHAQQFDLSASSVPAFTVWPAISPGKDNFEYDANGTEYFMSSLAVFEDSGKSDQIAVWGLSNTRSLRGTPDLSLNVLTVKVNPYAVPDAIAQKPGSAPLRECINDTALDTPFGKGCWNYLFAKEPKHDEALAPLDGNDSRMQQVVYANGELWGVLDTAVQGGPSRVGVAWYVLKPGASRKELVAKLKNQGYITAPGANSLTRPAIALNDDKKGAIGVTLAGPDYYPSAAFVGIDSRRGPSQLYLAAAGKGPNDGFTGYKAYGDPPRPRWGDYGAAFSDGSTLWVANEYIAQSCTLAQYVSTPFGSCGGTRATLGNWGTRISAIDVGN